MSIFSFFSGQEWLVVAFVAIIVVSAFMGKGKGGGKSGGSGKSSTPPPPPQNNQNGEG